jgi:Disulphide bond corrector protein DsbC
MKLGSVILLCLGFFGAPGVQDKPLVAKSVSGTDVTASSLPKHSDDVPVIVNAPHLQLALTHSGTVVTPGMNVRLIADILVAQDVHVYAPGVKDYRPLQLTIDPMPGIEPGAPSYPKSKLLFLKSINQQVPVFEGKFRVVQDVNILASPEFVSSLQPKGKAMTVTGELKYQACTLKVCFLPASVPLKWELQVTPSGHN